ncbi:hypothetical protein [uncultured Mitsuokella sp.]|uniref:hypothetical protein n=1 Tax=uncultured Mitsuokella sp. TaxID=453120 RepID=UPI002612FF4C|nr:hypothetical protein [uncultured Mitsuokella sp.]
MDDALRGAKYRDPTTKKAIARKEMADRERLMETMGIINAACKKRGLAIYERIVFIDVRTGQIYR